MLALGMATFVVSLGVTLLATPAVVWAAARFGAMDAPDERKLQAKPIPRVGGVAVFLGFCVGLGYLAAVTGDLFHVPKPGVYWRGLALAAAGLFLVGLIDDLRHLSFRWKFLAQLVAAGYVWYCGFRIEALSDPLGGQLDLGLWSLPVTLFWIIGITNAVNLIDGLDGLAAGTAAIMTGAVAVIALARGDLGVTATSVALVGSLTGFLWFNFNPARVYLGDCGSLFLGFVLAVTSVRGSQKGPAVIAVFVPLLVLGLPLLDTGFAVVRRALRLGSYTLRRGNGVRFLLRNLDHVFLPDRGHIHHRLLDLGLSHRGAVLTLYAVVCLMVTAAFALVLMRSVLIATLLVVVLAILLSVFSVLLYLQGRQRPSDEQGDAAAGNSEFVAVSSSLRTLNLR